MGNNVAMTRDETHNDSRFDEMQRELSDLRREVRLLRIANGELERIVVRDTLTPLYNRRFFLTALNDRMARLARYGDSALLIFVDVDALKQVNDRHGHTAGDYALCHIAQQLAANIRSTDVAARLGGDEFALLLDGVDEATGRDKIAELDAAIANARCNFGGTELPVFASFGLARVEADISDETIIARADADMYQTKRARRALRAVSA